MDTPEQALAKDPVAPVGLQTGHKLYLVALCTWILATGPAWWTMAVDWWDDPNYSHGLLIIPVACFFFWRQRNELRAIQPRVSLLGTACFLLVALMYLGGTAAAENFSVRVAAVTGAPAIAWALLGWPFVRKAWFAFAFLLFAVPWPYVIYYRVTFPLQLLSTDAACAVLKFLGITFIQKGNIVHLPGYSMEVVEACSGVRSLLSMTTLGAAYAYLTQPGYVRPWLLFAFSVPIALSANIFRLIITAVGAYAWDPAIAEYFLQEFSGLLVFSVALVLLVLTGVVISWLSRKLQPELS